MSKALKSLAEATEVKTQAANQRVPARCEGSGVRRVALHACSHQDHLRALKFMKSVLRWEVRGHGGDGSNSPSKRQSKGSLEEEPPSSGMN